MILGTDNNAGVAIFFDVLRYLREQRLPLVMMKFLFTVERRGSACRFTGNEFQLCQRRFSFDGAEHTKCVFAHRLIVRVSF